MKVSRLDFLGLRRGPGLAPEAQKKSTRARRLRSTPNIPILKNFTIDRKKQFEVILPPIATKDTELKRIKKNKK